MNAATEVAPYYRSAGAAADVAARYEALLQQWPVPCVRHCVPTSQGDTFVLEWGRADAPPVVLLHGSLANSLTWMGDAAAWAPHLHLFAVDMIGEPGFSAPSRPPLESDAYAVWLEEVLDALGLAQVSLVGISLGGWLGLDFAIRRSARVTSLSLIVPGGVGPQRHVLVWILPLFLLGAWGRNVALRRILGPPPQNPTTVEQRFGELFALMSKVFKPRYDHLPIFPDAALASLTMPVLAVVAGRDVMLAAGPMKARLEAWVPDLEMHYLPDAPHNPGPQTHRVLDFLQTAPARSASKAPASPARQQDEVAGHEAGDP